MLQRNFLNGEQARDAALSQVTDHNVNWMRDAIAFVASWVREQGDFIGEDVRHAVSRHLGAPKHHNAYGALVSQCVRLNIIEPTGEHRRMKDVKAHARETRVYRAYSNGENR